MCGNELRGDCEQEAVHERKPPLMCRHEHEQAAALKRIALSLGRMGRQFHDLGTLPHWQPPNSLNFFLVASLGCRIKLEPDQHLHFLCAGLQRAAHVSVAAAFRSVEESEASVRWTPCLISAEMRPSLRCAFIDPLVIRCKGRSLKSEGHTHTHWHMTSRSTVT